MRLSQKIGSRLTKTTQFWELCPLCPTLLIIKIRLEVIFMTWSHVSQMRHLLDELRLLPPALGLKGQLIPDLAVVPGTKA